APDLDHAPHPAEGHRVAPALEGDQTVARDPPRHDAIEGLVHRGQLLQHTSLRGKCLGDERTRGRAASRAIELFGPHAERALKVPHRGPAGEEEIGKRTAIAPHPALDLTLVRAGPWLTGIAREATRPGEGLEGRIDDG